MNDPNFEQNRIEYKANKDAADKNLKNGRSVLKKAVNSKHLESTNGKMFIRFHPHSVIYPGAETSREFCSKGDAKS